MIFNSMLFSCLPSLLNRKYTEISEPLSYGRTTISRAIDSGDILVKNLLELCNHYRIDISAYFIESGTVYMPTVIVVDEHRWTPITIDIELLSRYGFSIHIIRASQLACLMSVSEDVRDKVFSGGGHSATYVAPIHQVRRPSLSNRVAEEPKFPERQIPTGRYVYNWNLTKMLPHLLGVNGSQISLSIGRNLHFLRNTIRINDINVHALVDICNQYRIPISHFIQPDIPASITSPRKGWKPIKFYRDRIKQLYIPGGHNPLTVNQLAEIGDVDRRFIMGIKKPDFRVWMSVLIKICNKIGMSPMYFFCSNTEAAKIRRAHKMQGCIDSLE